MANGKLLLRYRICIGVRVRGIFLPKKNWSRFLRGRTEWWVSSLDRLKTFWIKLDLLLRLRLRFVSFCINYNR